MQALDQEAQQAVDAADLGAVALGVVQEEVAGMAVDGFDIMDLLYELQQGLLDGGILLRLGKDEEAAAADAGDAAGGWQVLLEERDDFLQQMLSEALAVLHADGVKLRHIDERRRVVVAMQPVLVGVLQAVHEHAAVTEESCLLVDEAEREVLLAALGRVLE